MPSAPSASPRGRLAKAAGRVVRAGLGRMGYELRKRPASATAARRGLPPDLDDHTRRVIDRIEGHTLTSPERVAALVEAVRYLVRSEVRGAFVECGVWRGGSAMAMALTLLEQGDTDRELWLYDTYTHMPFPGEEDVDLHGVHAADVYEEASAAEAFRYLSFDEVRAAVASTGYPIEKVRFVKGMVEDTIPNEVPERIALCRLDTDWYESTAHEMEHLYPRLAPRGVLIIDDYGHFMGAKKAVDEYVERHRLPVLLNRIDFTGRLVVKPA